MYPLDNSDINEKKKDAVKKKNKVRSLGDFIAFIVVKRPIDIIITYQGFDLEVKLTQFFRHILTYLLSN